LFASNTVEKLHVCNFLLQGQKGQKGEQAVVEPVSRLAFNWKAMPPLVFVAVDILNNRYRVG